MQHQSQYLSLSRKDRNGHSSKPQSIQITFSTDHKKMSGSSETMMLLSLLAEAIILPSPIDTWVTVPVCPPSLCTIFLVAVSQIYTHLSIEPHATYSPSLDQHPRINVFSVPWLWPLIVFVSLLPLGAPDLMSHIRSVSSKELDIRYAPSYEISKELTVSWWPSIMSSILLSAML